MPNDSSNSENQNFQDTTRFLANALHEIRTPIQTIIGAAELMQNTVLDKEQKEYLRQILFSAGGLLDLANNILDSAKMGQEGFKIENIPFDISKVLEYIADSEGVKAFNKGVELVLDISSSVPTMVTGDSMRVRQIMLNLISNAVKFTNEGYIHIELDYNKKDGILFSVTDTGIGISEEKQKKLFTDYFQADISTYRLFGGTGLGLSISKKLVNIMKGKIGVKSSPSGGSIFWFTLPLDAAIEKAPEVSCCKNPPSHKILIIDDNPLAPLNLQKKLASLGFTSVDICDNPENALEVLKNAEKENAPYELAFVSMVLGGERDGWHLALNIHNSTELSANTPLYLLVPEGQMHKDAKMKFLDLFRGYLYKPVKNAPLIEILKNEFCELLKLERENQKELEELSSPSPAKVAQGLKILVAEDHPMNRKLLSTFLKRFGAEVYIAENGVDALEKIKENPEISMVFMDIFMPGKSGVEATKELRAMHYNEIIIACTANNDTNDFTDYKKSGINDILVKPFKSETLKSMIEKWRAVMKTVSLEQITLLNSGRYSV